MRLIKLGGSVITRGDCPFLFDRDNVRRIAGELAGDARPFVLVHGTGLVGKRPAVEHAYARTGVIPADNPRLAFAVGAALRDLHGRFLEVLFESGVKALPMDAARCFGADCRSVRAAGLAAAIGAAARAGLAPVFHGDLMPQEDGSFRVLSSDTIMAILTRALHPKTVVMFTDVDGVYGRSAHSPDRPGPVMATLTRADVAGMYPLDGDAADVSGGMAEKVRHALDIAAECGSCTIASGRRPGVVARVLAGRDEVGTRVVCSLGKGPRRPAVASLLLLAGVLWAGGCASPASRFGAGLATGLGRVPDAGLAREGIPACILMLEGALSASPGDPRLLQAAAGLYGFYGGQLAETDAVRAQRLTERALTYALRAAGDVLPGLEQARTGSVRRLGETVRRADESDLDVLFLLGSVWTDWVRARHASVAAIGDLPRIEVIMERVVELDGAYRAGAAHLYLALLAATLPAEDAVIEAHFRRAIDAAAEHNRMPAVYHALWLRDRGRKEEARERLRAAIAAGAPDEPAHALMNELALERARQALAEWDRPQRDPGG
ncbi:MAG: hypothetical protein JXR77_16685 [Lentisphaeria bacterium]|nr:hypothetical protein [Lentisphaeria bacterium]